MGQANYASKAVQTFSTVAAGHSAKDLAAAMVRLIRKGRL
jgi:hypothetical protein